MTPTNPNVNKPQLKPDVKPDVANVVNPHVKIEEKTDVKAQSNAARPSPRHVAVRPTRRGFCDATIQQLMTESHKVLLLIEKLN